MLLLVLILALGKATKQLRKYHLPPVDKQDYSTKIGFVEYNFYSVATMPKNLSNVDPATRLDRIDRNILQRLQQDATMPVGDLAEQVGLSMTPCWRRIQRLERDGFIKKRIAIIDRRMVNARVTVFIAIRTRDHSIEWIETLRKAASEMTEIVDVYRMSGEVDYLIRAFLPDIESYDALYKKIIKKVPVADITSMFAMEEIKSTTEVPLDFI